MFWRTPLLSALCAAALTLAPDSIQAVPVDISADEISRSAEGVIIARGDVIIKREGETLKADEVTYRSKSEQLEARGHVILESSHATINADQAVIQAGSYTGNLENATITLPGGERIKATRLKRIDDQQFEAESLTFSACPIDEESWRVAADRALLDQQAGTLTAYDGSFQLWGVPVLYTPWWQQPLRRKSGLLMPKVASGKRRGTEIALPLYLAPSENWDATLTPHWMSARGVMGEMELRHISEVGHERLHGAIIDDNDVNRRRYRFDGDMQWSLPKEIIFDARGDYVSDRDFLADYDTGKTLSNYYLSSHAALSQPFAVSRISGDWSLQSQYLQNLLLTNNKSTLQILPRLESRMQLQAARYLYLHFDQQTTRFDRKLGIDGWRVDLHPYIEVPWESEGGGIAATLQFGGHHTRYDLSQTPAATYRFPRRTSIEASAELTSHFERISSSRNWRHVISPIMRYDHIEAPTNQAGLPNFDSGFAALTWSNLLSGNRYIGLDRIERASRATLLLESRLQHKASPEMAGRDLLIVRGGASYEQRLNSVDTTLQAHATRPFSNLLAEVQFYPSEQIGFSASGQYNHAERYWASGYANAGFSHGVHQFNIGYAYTDGRYATESQLITASAGSKIGERWRISGQWQYDTLLKLSQYASMMLKYEHPCWQLGIEGYRHNRASTTTAAAAYGFRILLEFRGVGSVGS